MDLRNFDKKVLRSIIDYENKKGARRWWGSNIFFHMHPAAERFETVKSGVSSTIQRLKRRGFIESGPGRLDGFHLTEKGMKEGLKIFIPGDNVKWVEMRRSGKIGFNFTQKKCARRSGRGRIK